MSLIYCHTHSAYDCQTCADEILSLGIQGDKDRIAALEREIERLREKAALLEQELETERMRLAACGVIALANTANSAIQARDMLPEYWSASAQDCASAVDREMDYRSRLAMAEKDRDELQKRAERMQKALSDIAEWTDRYTKPGHPVSTIARAAIAQEPKK